MEMSRVAQEEADAAAREEEEMIRQAIEASRLEEEKRAKVLQDEQRMSAQAIRESEQTHMQAQAAAQQREEEVKRPEAPVVSP